VSKQKRKRKLCHIEKFLSRRRRTYEASDYRQKEEDLNWTLIGQPRCKISEENADGKIFKDAFDLRRTRLELGI